jgi:hypothetical protein
MVWQVALFIVAVAAAWLLMQWLFSEPRKR